MANRSCQKSARQRQDSTGLRAWQLALRSDRQKPEFFQAGIKKPLKPKAVLDLAQKSSPKKGLKRKRGRTQATPDGKARVAAPDSSTTLSASSGSSSSPTKSGGKKRKAELMVIEKGDDIPVEHEPFFGRVMWAQFGGYQSYYPALVIKGSLVNLATPDFDQAFVYWFSDRKVSAVPRDKLLDFVPFFPERAPLCHGKQGQMGLLKAIEELRRRAEEGGHRLPDMDLLNWAQIGFPVLDNSGHQAFNPGPDFTLPESILERLTAIGTEILQKASQKDRDIPNEFYGESAIAAVREGSKNINDVCIGCADPERKVNCQHPLFEGGLCITCKECLQETFYAIGEDGTHSFCTLCGSGGRLFVCDIPGCGRVFCVPCVEELGGEEVLKKVQEARTWSCFLCQPFKPTTHGLLKPMPNWKDNLVLFFDMGHKITVVPDLEYFKTRRPIRVLSLFDGIGTGLLALQKAGFDVEVYYASETDQQAVLISQANHGNVIKQIGDITKLTTDMLSEITPIDLLIGGSPCNELSLANPLRKGFDVEGSGVLFFDFYRVLRDLVMLNGTTHLFWMFENVASMRTAFRTVISRFLQCQPAVWDAKHLSAQKRSRFFWGNIPGLYSTPELSDALRQEVDLNSVLTQQCDRQANVQRMRTITTQSNSLLQGPEQNTLPVTMAGNQDTLWLTELERLFGFPAHYTDAGNLAPTKRRALLGRSWSVQVVTEILRPLTEYFATINKSASDDNDGGHRTTTTVRDVEAESSNACDLTPKIDNNSTSKDPVTTAVTGMIHKNDQGCEPLISTNRGRVVPTDNISDVESMAIEAVLDTAASAASTTSTTDMASLSMCGSNKKPSMDNDNVNSPDVTPNINTSPTTVDENVGDTIFVHTTTISATAVGYGADLDESTPTVNKNGVHGKTMSEMCDFLTAGVTNLEVIKVSETAANATSVKLPSPINESNFHSHMSSKLKATLTASSISANGAITIPKPATVLESATTTTPFGKSAGHRTSRDNSFMNSNPRCIFDNNIACTTCVTPASHQSAAGTKTCMNWTLAPLKPDCLRTAADDACSVAESGSICTQKEAVSDNSSDDETCQFVAVGVKMVERAQPSCNLYHIHDSRQQQKTGNISVMSVDQQDAVHTDSKNTKVCSVYRESPCHCSCRYSENGEMIFDSQCSFLTKQSVSDKFQTTCPLPCWRSENNLGQYSERQWRSNYSTGASISAAESIPDNLFITGPPNNTDKKRQNPESQNRVVTKDLKDTATASSSTFHHSIDPARSSPCTPMNNAGTANEFQSPYLTSHTNSLAGNFKNPTRNLKSTWTIRGEKGHHCLSIIQNHPPCLSDSCEDLNPEYIEIHNGYLILKETKIQSETAPSTCCFESCAELSTSDLASSETSQHHVPHRPLQEEKLTDGNFLGCPINSPESHCHDKVKKQPCHERGNKQPNRITLYCSDETTCDKTEDDQKTNLDSSTHEEKPEQNFDEDGPTVGSEQIVSSTGRLRNAKTLETLESSSSGEKSAEDNSVNSVPRYMTRSRSENRKPPLLLPPTKMLKTAASKATSSNLTKQGTPTSADMSAVVRLSISNNTSISQVKSKGNNCSERPPSTDLMGNSPAEETPNPFHTNQNASVLESACRAWKSQRNHHKRTRSRRSSANTTKARKKNGTRKTKMKCTVTSGTKCNTFMKEDTAKLMQKMEMMCLKPAPSSSPKDTKSSGAPRD